MFALSSVMAERPGSCFIHCEDSSGALTNFTEVSFKRFLQCRRQWLSLEGCQRDVAVRTTQTICVEEEDSYENFNQLAFHRKCYSTFTNKTLLNRAESRRKKSKRQFEASQDEGVSSETSEPIPRKVLRSSFASPSTSTSSTTVSKRKHVLPPVCIICKKNLYYKLR